MLVLMDDGAKAFIAARFNNSWPASKDLTLRLFVNDLALYTNDQEPVPIDTLTVVDFTEASGGGYASKTMTCGNWTIDPLKNPAMAEYPEQVFAFSGPLDVNPSIYGYYVVDGNNVLQWAERLDAPFTPTTSAIDTLSITAKFQLSKGTPT